MEQLGGVHNLEECYFEDFADGHEDQHQQCIIKNDIQYHCILKNERDTIVKVLVLEATTTLCLVIISYRGHVSLVSGSDLTQSVGPSYQIPVLPGNPKPSAPQSRNCSWVCDAAVMDDAKAIVYSLSDRSLHFYDTVCSLRSDTVQEHRHVWRVIGLPHSVTSLCYHQGQSSEESVLFLGDEQGSITTLTFLQPSTLLFQRRGLESRPGQAEAVFWPDILRPGGPHSPYVTARVNKRVHSEAVLQLEYDHDQQFTLSCSLDTRRALVLRHKTDKLPSFVFTLDEGMRCFTFDSVLQNLATGSDDGIVRIWNPLVPSRPVACFPGHETVIADVLFARQNTGLLLSLCRFAELRVWDIEEQCCVQVAQLARPQVKHWASPRSLHSWRQGTSAALLVTLGHRLAEASLALPNSDQDEDLESSRTSSGPGQEEVEDWQDRQVDTVVGEVASMEVKKEGAVSSSGNLSAATSTSSEPKPLQLETMTLRLENIPTTKFIKPKFPPSALEIIDFSFREEDDEAPAGSGAVGMNVRIEQQTRLVSQRRQFVEQCAPHLALTLWPPDTILSPPNYNRAQREGNQINNKN